MRKAFISLLAVATLASCTQTEFAEQTTDNDKVEVKMTSTVADIEVGTRTPVTGVSSLATNVLLSKVTGDYTSTNLLYNGKMTFTDGSTSTSFDTPQYYPADGSSVYLCGLYPATGWTIGTAAATTAEYTFDGKTDVMVAAEKTSTKSDGQDGGTPQQLVFNHLLTNVIVKAIASTEGGATAAQVQAKWGEIKTITLSEAGGSATLNSKVTVNLKAGTAATASAFASGAATGFYKASGAASPYTYTDDLFSTTPIAIPTTETAIAYSMVAPVVVGAGAEFKVKITTAQQTTPIELPVDLTKDSGVTTDDMQGRLCIITLTFKAKEIKATASVTAWSNGGTSAVPVE